MVDSKTPRTEPSPAQREYGERFRAALGTEGAKRIGALALKVGISRQMLKLAFDGKRTLGSKANALVASELGVSADWLATGEGTMHVRTAWPFPGIDRMRFDDLTDSQKTEIQGIVRDRIEAFEAGVAVRPGRELHRLGLDLARAFTAAADTPAANAIYGWALSSLQAARQGLPVPPFRGMPAVTKASSTRAGL